MSGKHFGAERITDFLSYSSKAATDRQRQERAQVNLTDGCAGRASTSTFSRKSSFLRSQVLDDIPNLLILCLHLGNRHHQRGGERVAGKQHLGVFVIHVSRCLDLYERVITSPKTSVTTFTVQPRHQDISYQPKNVAVFLHLHRQKIQL